MLSHLKSRELAAAPPETGKQEIVTAGNSTNNSDADQQAAARLTCDALCSLASGVGRPTPSTRNPAKALSPSIPNSVPVKPLGMHGFLYTSAAAPVVTVPATPQPTPSTSSPVTTNTSTTTNNSATNTAKTSTAKMKSCPKQHQLPLFLSSKFIVIPISTEQCTTEGILDSEIVRIFF